MVDEKTECLAFIDYAVKKYQKVSLLYTASAKVNHYYSHYVPSFRKCC